MQRAVRLAVACLLGCVFHACVETEVSSIALRGVQPAVIEPGTRLRLEASGLGALGRCRVALRGVTHRPGSSLVSARAELDGQSVSDRGLLVDVDSALLGALGTQGSFVGELRVACQDGARARHVSNRLAVQFDLIQPLRRGTPQDRQQVARARYLLDFAGITASESESALYGVVIAATRAASPAARLGLAAGDRIVQADGVSVHALADLAPPLRARGIELRVRRLGETLDRRVLLSLTGLGSPELSLPQLRLSASIAWILVCGWLLGPLPRLARRCSPALLVPRRIPLPAMGLWGGALRAAIERGSGLGPRGGAIRRRSVLPITASTAGVLLVWFEPADFLALRSISIYFGIAAVSAALTLMNGSGPDRRRLRSALEMLGRMTVLGVLIACACALSGTRSLDGIVAEQGGWPWRWAGVCKPALLVAWPLYVAFASELGAATLPLCRGADTTAPRVGSAARWLLGAVIAERVLTNVALCALGVVLFAGGWQSPAELHWEGLPARLPGAALFVVKAWGFAGLLAWARDARWGARLRPQAAALGCLTTTALTGLWLWLDPALVVQLELGLGRVLGTASIPIAIAMLARRSARYRAQSPGSERADEVKRAADAASAGVTLGGAATSTPTETAPSAAVGQGRYF